MSIPLQGCVRSKSAGLWSAIVKQLRGVNLKPVSNITVQFDPFADQVYQARKFLFYISAPKIQATNLFCALKTKIVCDRSPAVITCNLNTGEKVIFNCANLEALDVLKLYNKHISSLVPIEKPEPTGRPPKKKKLRVKQRIPRRRR